MVVTGLFLPYGGTSSIADPVRIRGRSQAVFPSRQGSTSLEGLQVAQALLEPQDHISAGHAYLFS